MAQAAPSPEHETRLARARRAVSIRLREKRAKDEAYLREHGKPRPEALREAGAFARWYLSHLLKNPDEIDEVLAAELLREEDEKERERLRAEAPRRVSPEESPALAAYRRLREGRGT